MNKTKIMLIWRGIMLFIAPIAIMTFILDVQDGMQKDWYDWVQLVIFFGIIIDNLFFFFKKK